MTFINSYQQPRGQKSSSNACHSGTGAQRYNRSVNDPLLILDKAKKICTSQSLCWDTLTTLQLTLEGITCWLNCVKHSESLERMEPSEISCPNAPARSKNLQRWGAQCYLNPPAGSHHGDSWEQLILSVRNILNITVKKQLLDEGLHILPITKASSHLSDLEILMSTHLLLLKVKPKLPPGVFNKDNQ